MGRGKLTKARSPNSDRVELLVMFCLLGGAEVGAYFLFALVVASAGGSGHVQFGITFRTWIWLFFVAGPMTLFLAPICALWVPRLAGVWLVGASFATAKLAVVVMTPITWSSGGPGSETLGHYAFKWSLTLIIPFSLPMFTIGMWLIFSRPVHLRNESEKRSIGTDR